MKTYFKRPVFFLIFAFFTHVLTITAQFYGPRTVTDEKPGGPRSTNTCDLDSDGDLDIIFTRSGKAWWLQNTGNDTAYQIVIRDALDYTLDRQSFRPLGSSHPFRSALDPSTGEVVFTFEHINLPDSNVNQIGSQGFVQFEILPIAGLAPGTVLPNTASIYFDFNPPVITNTAECRVQSLVETVEAQPESSGFSIAPNPGKTYFLVNFDRPLARAARLIVRASDGRSMLEKQLEAGRSQIRLEAENWPSGVYFVRVGAGDCGGGRFVKE